MSQDERMERMKRDLWCGASLHVTVFLFNCWDQEGVFGSGAEVKFTGTSAVRHDAKKSFSPFIHQEKGSLSVECHSIL